MSNAGRNSERSAEKRRKRQDGRHLSHLLTLLLAWVGLLGDTITYTPTPTYLAEP
ncbi:MAG: hypothetical protein M0Z95_26220 [Actinomycetota bacterium]|jgi:hypothetical protein|nr:hypothetical protein [Actinomycetota bacterium]